MSPQSLRFADYNSSRVHQTIQYSSLAFTSPASSCSHIAPLSLNQVRTPVKKCCYRSSPRNVQLLSNVFSIVFNQLTHISICTPSCIDVSPFDVLYYLSPALKPEALGPKVLMRIHSGQDIRVWAYTLYLSGSVSFLGLMWITDYHNFLFLLAGTNNGFEKATIISGVPVVQGRNRC